MRIPHKEESVNTPPDAEASLFATVGSFKMIKVMGLPVIPPAVPNARIDHKRIQIARAAISGTYGKVFQAYGRGLANDWHSAYPSHSHRCATRSLPHRYDKNRLNSHSSARAIKQRPLLKAAQLA
jgi:hypothetical protein